MIYCLKESAYKYMQEIRIRRDTDIISYKVREIENEIANRRKKEKRERKERETNKKIKWTNILHGS